MASRICRHRETDFALVLGYLNLLCNRLPDPTDWENALFRCVTLLGLVVAIAVPVSASESIADESADEAVEEVVESITCRRFRPTGSRVRTIRACMTRRDWRRVYAYWGHNLQYMMGSISPGAGVGHQPPPEERQDPPPEERQGFVYLEGSEGYSDETEEE